ncbi:MAG: sodium/proline symporter [Cloacibacillus porcorum]|nr:sodium/proline symporter [Cloacibacillus porcorum]
MSDKLPLVVPFVLYLIALIAIRIYTFRFTKTMEGFHLGGRSLNPWVAGISLMFSGSSGWIFTGMAGLCYAIGPSSWFMHASNLFFMLIAFLMIGKRMRNYSGILGAITYPEYFVRRVRARGNMIRVVASLAVVMFMSVSVATQYMAASKSMMPLFGMTNIQAILITAAVVGFYCLIGGFLAVCWTDFVQGIVILIGSVTLCLYMIYDIGGWSNVTSKLAEIDPKLVSAEWATFPLILAYWTTGFQCIGRPHDTIRYFAVKDSRSTRKMAMIGMFGFLLNYWTGYLIGWVRRNYFPNIPDPETSFGRRLTGVPNPWFSGIMLAALMALIMSTVDSCLLSAASTLSEDFYHACINKNASKERLVNVSLFSVLFIAVVGIFLAVNSGGRSIMTVMLFASGGLAATFGPALILSLYWKRLTEGGVIAAMFTGFVMSVTWNVTGMAKVSNIHEGCIGFLLSLAAGVIVSLITKPLPQDEIRRELKAVSKDYNAEQLERVVEEFQSVR